MAEERRISMGEVRKTIATSLGTAFGFVIALVWSNVVLGGLALTGAPLTAPKECDGPSLRDCDRPRSHYFHDRLDHCHWSVGRQRVGRSPFIATVAWNPAHEGRGPRWLRRRAVELRRAAVHLAVPAIRHGRDPQCRPHVGIRHDRPGSQ